MSSSFLSRATASAALVVTAAAPALAQDVTGAGASFPAPVYSKWADAYNKATGARINYQSVGSGAGIQPDQAPRPSTSAPPTRRSRTRSSPRTA